MIYSILYSVQYPYDRDGFRLPHWKYCNNILFIDTKIRKNTGKGSRNYIIPVLVSDPEASVDPALTTLGLTLDEGTAVSNASAANTTAGELRGKVN
jgi:hypothetical protein